VGSAAAPPAAGLSAAAAAPLPPPLLLGSLRAPRPPPAAPAPPASLAKRAARLSRFLPLSKWDLPASLSATKVNGVWHRPKVTSLMRASIRRAALLA
jgi:hypothetical protein